ncbi:hypothetical protein ACMAZF_09695 [Psychrobium sp. nBUS_13]
MQLVLVDAHVKNHRIENGQILVAIMFDSNSLDKSDALLDELSIDAE